MDNTTQKEKNPAAKQDSNTQIVTQENQIVNFDPELQVQQATIAAKALMTVVSQKAKKVQFNGEQYLEFEDWQTIAQFYNHTVGIEWTKPIEANGKLLGFEAKAILYHNGQIVGGAEAACMNDEPNWSGRFNKKTNKVEPVPMFQLRSMAQTRAMAKALRSRFGFVAVLAGFKPTPAEEMQDVFQKTKFDDTTPGGSEHYHATQSPQAEYYCETHDLPLVLRPAGKTTQGKAYKPFWACPTPKVNGKFCFGPFTDTEGNRVKQNPQSGEMEVMEKVHEAEIVFDKPPVESSVDKARRILNATVPKPYQANHEGD